LKSIATTNRFGNRTRGQLCARWPWLRCNAKQKTLCRYPQSNRDLEPWEAICASGIALLPEKTIAKTTCSFCHPQKVIPMPAPLTRHTRAASANLWRLWHSQDFVLLTARALAWTVSPDEITGAGALLARNDSQSPKICWKPGAAGYCAKMIRRCGRRVLNARRHSRCGHRGKRRPVRIEFFGDEIRLNP
jgi:hypothetical protein